MEHHGNNPRKNIIAIIPARYQSARLPGKLLLPLSGKPLILHTAGQARKAVNIDRVIVATDDQRIYDVARENGFEAVKTSPDHQSGSDRIAEVAEKMPEHSIIVNVQGDEPLISPSTIEKAVDSLIRDETVNVATTCEAICDIKDVLSPDVVKVTIDKSGFALYRKHTGLYVYRREFLLKYTKQKQTNLEKTELLEQLRVLENGERIKVVEVSESSIGVDTREDFERVRRILEKAGERF